MCIRDSLMGVGTPVNILEGIERGVDMFDCVMPTRNGRNGMLFTKDGIINMYAATFVGIILLSGTIYLTFLKYNTEKESLLTVNTRNEVEPVSYTHLDVYKRQTPTFVNLKSNTMKKIT